jgi:hypothetical protein
LFAELPHCPVAKLPVCVMSLTITEVGPAVMGCFAPCRISCFLFLSVIISKTHFIIFLKYSIFNFLLISEGLLPSLSPNE